MAVQRGEDSVAAKLTEEKVRQIRDMYANPCTCCGRTYSSYDLGKMFKVSHVSIFNIVNRLTWKHVQ